jgi:hypothetical protein
MHRIFILVFALFGTLAQAADAIAISVVFDTSGSMLAPVKDADGKQTAKWQVARRNLESVAAKIGDFSKASGKPVQLALFAFDGKTGTRQLIARAPFDAAKLAAEMPRREDITGGTPLGTAIQDAGELLMATSGVTSRHVLAITDGENSTGPKPEAVVEKLKRESATNGRPVNFHIIAFDVNSEVFAGVKKQGATVVSASDEAQLRERLASLLEERILLEKD